jgi:hypothetical protein
MKRSSAAPKTRAGGPITLRGREYATEAELEAALVGALVEAGWKLTEKGAAYLEALEAAEARAEAEYDRTVNA